MSKFSVASIRPQDLNIDTDPIDVQEEWTFTESMRFKQKSIEKHKGEQLNRSVSGGNEPYHLIFNGNYADPYWVYFGTSGASGIAFATDLTTEWDITGAPVSDTAITSCIFNNFVISAKELAAPEYWGNDTGAPFLSLPNFLASTTCNIIRPYRTFLIALNINTATGNEPQRLIWSDSADAGALPQSWDITSPTTLAGDAWLTDSPGSILDGAQMRDLFVIYKTHSIYLMRLTGSQSVMQISKVQANAGILATDCVQEFEGKHFFAADGDFFVFDGQSIQTVAEDRVRSYIFDNLNKDALEACFVVRYDKEDEMWFCYPDGVNTTPNRAAVWNWRDNRWSFKDVNNARHIAAGLVTTRPDLIAGTDNLLGARPGQLVDHDLSNNLDSNPIETVVEKLTMDFGDPEMVKMVKSVTPLVTAEAGTGITVQIGTQMEPYDAITWTAEQGFDVGTSRHEVPFTEKGRYISIRMKNNVVDQTWACHGANFKLALSGKQ